MTFPSRAGEDEVSFENNEVGFRMPLPPGWKIIDTPEVPFLAEGFIVPLPTSSPSNFRGPVRADLRRLESKDVDPYQYGREYVARLMERPNHRKFEQIAMRTREGKPLTEVISRGGRRNPKVQFIYFGQFADGFLYQFSYTTTRRDQYTVRHVMLKIVCSIEVFEPNSGGAGKDDS